MKTIVSPKDILLTYVDTMILLSKTAFDVKREVSHYQAFDYLAPAEQICTDNGFASGYRWISSAYYTLGAAMVTAGNLSSAVYPLRKACTLLEKDEQRSQSDAGRLQLTKRYEVLGTCCQKIVSYANFFFFLQGALSNFRLALARVPQSNILAFIDKADSLTVARLAVQQPLIPKLMDRFLRTSVGDHEQGTYASGYLKMAGLTPIQKAVVYECELKIFLLLSHRMNLSKEINNLIAAILNEYSQDRYPIRRAR
ncbi:hypothetical protein DM01DRAFT_253400 [Hesseltinella vesiculosa]|uniref:Uncharacterized protein n=1 Tax=Hesseltinella vesiculosa TaxID=101127 RepID=A0A1X2GJU7_9FUNG|nr:hypothetical protein DM01DRAFT_253400 [Hesseltinella vesiculosa]